MEVRNLQFLLIIFWLVFSSCYWFSTILRILAWDLGWLIFWGLLFGCLFYSTKQSTVRPSQIPRLGIGRELDETRGTSTRVVPKWIASHRRWTKIGWVVVAKPAPWTVDPSYTSTLCLSPFLISNPMVSLFSKRHTFSWAIWHNTGKVLVLRFPNHVSFAAIEDEFLLTADSGILFRSTRGIARRPIFLRLWCLKPRQCFCGLEVLKMGWPLSPVALEDEGYDEGYTPFSDTPKVFNRVCQSNILFS